MKLATNRYAVKVRKDGKAYFESYYGYKTKHEAEARAEMWRKAGYETEIIDNKK